MNTGNMYHECLVDVVTLDIATGGELHAVHEETVGIASRVKALTKFSSGGSMRRISRR